MPIGMARNNVKRAVLLTGMAILLFLLGGLAAILIFQKGEEGLFISSSFKNPSGPPHIEGPSGPPPLTHGETVSPLTP
jgi:hypothetical protein